MRLYLFPQLGCKEGEHYDAYQPASSTVAERDARVPFEGPVSTCFCVSNVSPESAFLLLRLLVVSVIHKKLFLLKEQPTVEMNISSYL